MCIRDRYYRGTKEARPQRSSARRPVVGIRAPQFYACRDGYVQVNISTGGFGSPGEAPAAIFVDATASVPYSFTSIIAL